VKKVSRKLKIGARMKHQADLNSPQSPAGRAPTLLIRIVGARTERNAKQKADSIFLSWQRAMPQSTKENRNIAPTFHSTPMQLNSMGQQQLHTFS
jgi:hypothetical protein